jgi:hypothetical protein
VIWPCRCRKCLEQVKQEFNLVKSKLEHMFEVILFSRNALVLLMDLFWHMWTRLCQIIDPQNLTWWLEAIIYSEEVLLNCRPSALVFQGMGRSLLVPHNRVWDVSSLSNVPIDYSWSSYPSTRFSWQQCLAAVHATVICVKIWAWPCKPSNLKKNWSLAVIVFFICYCLCYG